MHAAFNFWFHPPDNLSSFENPYASPFWPRDWEERAALERAETTKAKSEAEAAAAAGAEKDGLDVGF